MSDKIKIGIIGCGGISGAHLSGYEECEDVELYAFCDIKVERAKEYGEKYNVSRIFEDYNEMLKLPELDAVSVCVPNALHAPITIAALNAGKNVLCEKPMATSAEDAKKMEEAAKKAGKLLMIGFVRRHGSDMKMLKEFIANDRLGDVYYGKVCILRRNGNPMGWFARKEVSGGGPLIDLGVHVIDFVRYALGNIKPVAVYGAAFKKLLDRPGIKTPPPYVARSAKEYSGCDVEDMATAMIRFENGFILQVEVSFCLNIKEGKNEIELFGTKGGVKFAPDMEIYSEMDGFMTNVTLAADTSFDFGGAFVTEIRHFVDCLEGKTETIAPAEDGIELMKILDGIYESAKTCHEVIL